MGRAGRPEKPFASFGCLDARRRLDLEGYAADCAARSPTGEDGQSAISAHVLAFADALPMTLAVQKRLDVDRQGRVSHGAARSKARA
jgi:hypothetical protein